MSRVDSKTIPIDVVYSCIGQADPDNEKDEIPIILIHGLSMTKESWKGIDEVLSLKTGKRVYVVDLRNHGESAYTEECDVETMTVDVIHLMDKLKISKAVVLGHSLGGKIAVHLALNYPTRIESIIVEDMRPNGLSSAGLEEVLLYLEGLKDLESVIAQGLNEKDAKEIIAKRMNDVYKQMNLPVTLEAINYLPIKSLDGKYQWNFNPMLIKSFLKDFNEILNESSGCFDGVSLFIYGAESNFKVKEDENNIKRLFPNAQLFGVKGGHMVHLYPEFMETVIQFINGNRK